ncbi:hypothetical protein NHX12_005259, partial [Muraenolepis orangiensis]
ILERMVHSRIEPVVDSQLPREQAGFRRGRSTADQVTLLCQDIEDSFQDNEKAGILERMVHSRIEPVVDSQLPREQAGFRRGRSTADQVTLLCQDIEDSFQDNEKAGVVYLDLTAAYDTVWHRELHLKLLRTIPDRHMVKFIMETLSNRSFILQTSSGQCSRLRRLKNGVPQGSVLSPMLFNVYIHDLPDTASRKYGYADDLAIMLSRPTWKAMEEGLNEDMGTLVPYLRRWRLQLSVGKSVAAAYHLSTREARRELEVRVDNKCLEVQQAPKYLGVRLDRTLSFKQHLEEVKAKVTSRVALIRRLAGTTWGASAKTLRISTQALVFSAAEYCAPVWSRSPHARKVFALVLGDEGVDGAAVFAGPDQNLYPGPTGVWAMGARLLNPAAHLLVARQDLLHP